MNLTQYVTELTPRSNGKMLDPAKEQLRGYAVVTLGDSGFLITPIKARVWRSRRGTGPLYASIFVHANERGIHTTGHAKVGGGGFHMISEAIERACTSAGITFSEEFGGHGDDAVEQALLALADHLGYAETDTTVVVL